MAERRAGKYIADVYSGGTNGNYNTLYKGKVLDPIKPALILPEVVDLSKWYGNEHRYADPEGQYIFAYLANPSDAQLGVQLESRQSERVQVLLGRDKSQMER